MNLDQREWCRLEMLIYVDKKRELTRKNKDYYWRNKLWNADEKIGARIRQFMDDCNTFYEQGQLSKARDSLFEAWGILPDEKYIYDESYWIVAFILDLSIELHDMDVANQWVDKILKCDLERQDDGDREMWVGKVLCESGKTDEAKKYFEIAFKKSRGKVFCR